MEPLQSTQRVVITGIGVVAPNGGNVREFEANLRAGNSGIRDWPEAGDLGIGCRVAGIPEVDLTILDDQIPAPRRRALNRAMEYATVAAIECWRSAGLNSDPERTGETDWNTGVAVGTGIGSIDIITDTVTPLVSAGQHRRMGARIVERAMVSGPAATISGILGAGGPSITVSSACASAGSALHHSVQVLRRGQCRRMLAGGVEVASLHILAMFDSMRVVCRNFNGQPHRASRPLSATASGFVPAAGAGFLLLETLESARQRNATVFAELLGSWENSGGQRGDGSMTLACSEGVVRCVRAAMLDAGITADDVDYVNGHLTGTVGDVREIRSLSTALRRDLKGMPWVNSTKSLMGHCLGAAGAIEAVATVLQLRGGFLHPSTNCEDVHPEIEDLDRRVPRCAMAHGAEVALKLSLGFGDVNTCLVFRKWNERN
jgi:3-oxoacyl-(acyl-carrier-protein) synthase